MEIERLRLEKIHFSFDGDRPVFQGLTLELPKAPLIWIRAPHGYGKSTLLKVFGVLLNPSSGRYWINDVDVLELSFREFLPYRFAIGYSFDTFGLLSNRTIRENLLLPLLFHKRCAEREAERRVDHWMERFQLSTCGHLRPYAVTGSQRKAAVVLRAFLNFPQVVFLDDPLAGLKSESATALAELVEDGRRHHGLKKIVYCSERELSLIEINSTEVHLSNSKTALLEAV